ncbi:MAG: sulfatase-like hydrolase/transferase [Clostridia bacterium]|nr:sulfatase-like hydrolase/transferase [Clostridia bacterium]
MKKAVQKKKGCVPAAVLVMLSALVLLGVRWLLATWPHLSMDEMVYHLTATIDGVDPGLVRSGIMTSILPALAAGMVSLLIFRPIRRRGLLLLCTLVVFVLSLTAAFWQMDRHVQLRSWLRAQFESSDFIAENYADPADVKVEFPRKKRNLVYIFLESMETTFADTENGGAREVSVIPNLTRIAQENEDFSGSDPLLNGGKCFPSTTWTMGAMFAHTAGLPLKVAVEGNSMGEQTHFFPGIMTLGDILQDAGYTQTLLIGSDAKFGGRALYFSEHGAYTLHDYVYAQEKGRISRNYRVFWGHEDEKLFTFAREELLELASGEQPFNLTLLTVDTHFEDGYLCRLCGDSQGDKYANVILCSDCQVAEFVAWIQEQPFYENTTIVLAGDHLTMDSDFCENIPESYDRRVYTAVINAACETEDPALRRAYSTFDLFPTTLASMGVKIKGDRLGLGVNLFSGEKTLIEKYGFDTASAELRKNSPFMREKSQVFVMELKRYNAQNNTMQLYVEGLQLVDDSYVLVEAVQNGEAQILYQVQTNGKLTLTDTVKLPDAMRGDMELSVYCVDKEGNRTKGCGYKGHPLALITDAGEYLNTLAQMKDCSVLMAVKDEAGENLTEAIWKKLQRLGLEKNLAGQYRASYCAVITTDGVEEKLAFEPVKLNGKLPDDVKYRLMSAGHDAGNRVSVKLDGDEYAVDRRGINMVVYDHITQMVIDSLCIDSHDNCDIRRAKQE